MGGDCFIDKDTVQARQCYCDHIKSLNMAQNVSFEGDVIVMTAGSQAAVSCENVRPATISLVPTSRAD